MLNLELIQTETFLNSTRSHRVHIFALNSWKRTIKSQESNVMHSYYDVLDKKECTYETRLTHYDEIIPLYSYGIKPETKTEIKPNLFEGKKRYYSYNVIQSQTNIN